MLSSNYTLDWSLYIVTLFAAGYFSAAFLGVLLIDDLINSDIKSESVSTLLTPFFSLKARVVEIERGIGEII